MGMIPNKRFTWNICFTRSWVGSLFYKQSQDPALLVLIGLLCMGQLIVLASYVWVNTLYGVTPVIPVEAQ